MFEKKLASSSLPLRGDNENGLLYKLVPSPVPTPGFGLVRSWWVWQVPKPLLKSGKPLLAVDLKSHVRANYIDSDLEPPFVALVVSGGHTQIMHFSSYKAPSRSRSDPRRCLREAYDKVAAFVGAWLSRGPADQGWLLRGNPEFV
ncbi:MAG: hypothetical protein IPM93_23990 [Candidatus Obscuribacter sp.]|nr:hypothetical protein [Candidatus Obscuribacter sp.]